MVLGKRIQVLWLLFEQPHLGQTAVEQRFKGQGFPQILPFYGNPMMGTKHPAPVGPALALLVPRGSLLGAIQRGDAAHSLQRGSWFQPADTESYPGGRAIKSGCEPLTWASAPLNGVRV